jgi:hypothetical protein
MATCQCGGRRAQPLRIDRATIEFDVKMPGHPAELLVRLASDPHRVLHRGQCKRLVRRVCGAVGGKGLLVSAVRVGGELGPGLDRRGRC